MAEASTHHRPGEPPPVRDEAADTPLWMPLLGLCLLVIGVLAVLWQASTGNDEAAGQAPEAAQAADEANAADEGGAPAEDEHAGHDH